MKVESNLLNSGTLVANDNYSFSVVNEPNRVDYLVFLVGDDKVLSIMTWTTNIVGFSAKGSSIW